MKGWNINFESDIRKKKEKLASEFDRLDKLSETVGLSVDDWEHLQECMGSLSKIMKEEELKWLQRSGEKELLEGDNNTKYYHAKANGRTRKNRIVRLHREEGVIEGQDNLKKYITVYKNLFGRSNISSIQLNTIWGGSDLS